MNTASLSGRLPALLNDLALLAMMLVLAAILTTAMTLQYVYGELPCPLCLLQRLAMFGVCFGIILHFRHGYSVRHTGLSLLFALFLLIVSVRQTLLDIYPRPGHSYIGTAVFGLHMPVWSVLIALAILLAFAIKLTVLGGERLRDAADRAGAVEIRRPLAALRDRALRDQFRFSDPAVRPRRVPHVRLQAAVSGGVHRVSFLYFTRCGMMLSWPRRRILSFS